MMFSNLLSNLSGFVLVLHTWVINTVHWFTVDIEFYFEWEASLHTSLENLKVSYIFVCDCYTHFKFTIQKV